MQGDVQATCFAMEHAARQRTTRIYPAYRRTVAAPLIFVLHGGGGSASSMELLTRGAFNRIADREGAIVVYPEGVDRHWNDGRDLPETAARENIDDVGFILALIEEVARQYSLDRGRIFSTGISNGGFMSMRLACDAAETFAAVAPVTAVLSEKLGAAVRPHAGGNHDHQWHGRSAGTLDWRHGEGSRRAARGCMVGRPDVRALARARRVQHTHECRTNG